MTEQVLLMRSPKLLYQWQNSIKCFETETRSENKEGQIVASGWKHFHTNFQPVVKLWTTKYLTNSLNIPTNVSQILVPVKEDICTIPFHYRFIQENCSYTNIRHRVQLHLFYFCIWKCYPDFKKPEMYIVSNMVRQPVNVLIQIYLHSNHSFIKRVVMDKYQMQDL